MSDRRYLIDNNALSRLTPEQRLSSFFRERCRVTTDVFHEASGYVESEIRDLEEPVTVAVLTRLVNVMGSVTPGDTSLVDLYANKGAADPVMIACALELQAIQDSTLFPDEWVIVTDDKAVTTAAQGHGVSVLNSARFQALFPSDSRQSRDG